jgi:hypothetical protein
MNISDAIIKMMRIYWENVDDYDSMETSQGRKYNKKYFDSVEAEFLNKEDQSKTELKKGKI